MKDVIVDDVVIVVRKINAADGEHWHFSQLSVCDAPKTNDSKPEHLLPQTSCRLLLCH